MHYLHQHIQTILTQYTGTQPLAQWLKAYTKKHPKLGSRDRRILGEMAYSWYRVRRAFNDDASFEDALYASLFLTGVQQGHLLQLLPQYMQDGMDASLQEKTTILQNHQITTDLEKLLPNDIAFSAGIERSGWLESMLRQPALFLRQRPIQPDAASLLTKQDVAFQQLTPTCLALPNGTKVEDLLPPKTYVVQDASSQATGQYFNPQKGQDWWDCCSGAGGKSLLLTELQPDIHLLVTDKREPILQNLTERFQLYFEKVPRKQVLDLADARKVATTIAHRRFDGIICDAPCSGSGTWARTPEALHFFDAASINELHQLQTAIATNAAAYLKPGGRFIYITCSVFKEENEDVVAQLISQRGLHLQSQHLINGISHGADSMFVAVLERRVK